MSLQTTNLRSILKKKTRPPIEYLIEAFPLEEESFDRSGFLVDDVWLFLSVRRDSDKLPTQPQAERLLYALVHQLQAGKMALHLDLAPEDREPMRRLAAVSVEARIEGVWRAFSLLAGYEDDHGRAEIWLSQGFHDFVLEQWDSEADALAHWPAA